MESCLSEGYQCEMNATACYVVTAHADNCYLVCVWVGGGCYAPFLMVNLHINLKSIFFFFFNLKTKMLTPPTVCTLLVAFLP